MGVERPGGQTVAASLAALARIRSLFASGKDGSRASGYYPEAVLPERPAGRRAANDRLRQPGGVRRWPGLGAQPPAPREPGPAESGCAVGRRAASYRSVSQEE